MARAPIRSVLFLPASGPGVGGGHVLRCLTLAAALHDRGLDCAFAVAEAGGALIERFGERTFRRLPRPSEDDFAIAARGFDLAVVDDYGLGARQETSLRSEGRRVLVLDDLANRPHLCDMLVDAGHGRAPADYAPWISTDAVQLLGPDYALVRRAFAARRTASLDAAIAPTPRRVFVSFGLSDVDGIAARAVEMIRAVLPTVEIDLALSSTAASLKTLTARRVHDPHLHLHVDATGVAALMAGADIAVGAGGGGAWERCCLGLPSLVVIVADNQRHGVRRLAADGALLAVDLKASSFDADFQAALRTMEDRDVRLALRRRAAALCDGRGAERVAEAVLTL